MHKHFEFIKIEWRTWRTEENKEKIKESWRINHYKFHNNLIVISNPSVFSVTGCKIWKKGESPLNFVFNTEVNRHNMESRQVKALLQIYHTWFISLYDFHFVINVLGNDWTSQKRWPTQKEHTVSWRHLIIKKFKQILYGRFSTLTFGLKDWFKVTPKPLPTGTLSAS